jgi:hypothetical protein
LPLDRRSIPIPASSSPKSSKNVKIAAGSEFTLAIAARNDAGEASGL